MSKSKKSRKSSKELETRIFKATGMSIQRFVLVVIGSIGILVAIVVTVMHENGKKTSADPREAASIALDDAASRLKMSQEEMYSEVSSVIKGFDARNSLEKITLLNGKVELCHSLIDSNSDFVEDAKDRLIRIYGLRMTLEDKEGINSSESSEKLDQLRSRAVQEGNKERVNLADFVIAFARMKRLETNNTLEDFRLTAEAIQRIDAGALKNTRLVSQLQGVAIGLFDNLEEKKNITELLKFMGAKFSQSQDVKISEMGLDIRDYPFFSRFYLEIQASAFTSRDKRFALFRDLFEQIEKTPPVGPQAYRETIFFLDKLLNEKDSEYIGVLLDKLTKAAAATAPKLKSKVELAISRMGKRAAALGKVADLSGSRADGSALGLPNGKKTIMVFWRSNDLKSTEFAKSLAFSNRFDTWTTNIVFASDSEHSDRAKRMIARSMSKSIVLDGPTSNAMIERFGLDRVPYVVTFDKDGTVLRMSDDVN